MQNVNILQNIVYEIAGHTQFIKLFQNESFEFDSGERLNDIEIAYQTYGKLNSAGDNAILICHALTGNAHAAGIITESEILNCESHEFLNKYSRMYLNKTGWWDPLIGKGKLFDTDKYFVVCSNIVGSCYGSSGPATINSETGEKYNLSFPTVTVRDMVRLQKELTDSLSIKKIVTAVGGSLGGMQVLEWAIQFSGYIESIIPIAASAAHSPWAMALNKTAKDAIKTDPEWNNGHYNSQPSNGLSLARQIAMISYRTFSSFEPKFNRRVEKNEKGETNFSIENYLNYQGKKLVERFDANSYLYLAEAMDLHDIGKNRGGVTEVLQSIDIPTLCIGINSDVLYPAEEQKSIAGLIPKAVYKEINSIHGHDGFLIEFEQLFVFINEFLAGFE